MSTFIDLIDLTPYEPWFNAVGEATRPYRTAFPYLIWGIFFVVLVIFIFVELVIPQTRKPTPGEKQFTTVNADGKLSQPQQLPCWHDWNVQQWDAARKEGKDLDIETIIEPAELFMTVVVPAYNEEKRLVGMLEEAVNFLETEYGIMSTPSDALKDITNTSNNSVRQRRTAANGTATSNNTHSSSSKGWEILIVNDGSKDATIETAANFIRNHLNPLHPRRMSGPWTHRRSTTSEEQYSVSIPAGTIRLVSLESNRGKGGAVTHGMRHARGQYVMFADADGASKFSDLPKLVSACQSIKDDLGRGVAVGSRAHLVGSEAVVKRSFLRNFLMHSFHLLLKFMTPSKTAKIRDTQCGFKLFSRPSLPYIIPHMHTEGWIFDVEMLMLAEFAGIPVAEVAVGWKEVGGSKLNVIVDSIGMAWGLAVLRFCWAVGIWRR